MVRGEAFANSCCHDDGAGTSQAFWSSNHVLANASPLPRVIRGPLIGDANLFWNSLILGVQSYPFTIHGSALGM